MQQQRPTTRANTKIGDPSDVKPRVIETPDEDFAERVRALKAVLHEERSRPDAVGFSVKASGPLTDSSRKLKRPLVLLSTLAVVMIKTGLIPEKISALGIEFTKANQNVIFLLLGLSILYFLIGFVLYLILDLLAWFHSLAITDWEIYPFTPYLFKRKSLLANFLVFMRISYEIIIPIVLAFYATSLIWEPSQRVFHEIF